MILIDPVVTKINITETTAMKSNILIEITVTCPI